jgi:hypothetical protein
MNNKNIENQDVLTVLGMLMGLAGAVVLIVKVLLMW